MTTLARTTDPHTSHDAAAAITASGKAATHRELVLLYVRRHPGATSGEVAAMTGLERHEAARRLSDLKRLGDAVQGDARRCQELGTTCVTWWPTPLGQRFDGAVLAETCPKGECGIRFERRPARPDAPLPRPIWSVCCGDLKQSWAEPIETQAELPL